MHHPWNDDHLLTDNRSLVYLILWKSYLWIMIRNFTRHHWNHLKLYSSLQENRTSLTGLGSCSTGLQIGTHGTLHLLCKAGPVPSLFASLLPCHANKERQLQSTSQCKGYQEMFDALWWPWGYPNQEYNPSTWSFGWCTFSTTKTARSALHDWSFSLVKWRHTSTSMASRCRPPGPRIRPRGAAMASVCAWVSAEIRIRSQQINQVKRLQTEAFFAAGWITSSTRLRSKVLRRPMFGLGFWLLRILPANSKVLAHIPAYRAYWSVGAYCRDVRYTELFVLLNKNRFMASARFSIVFKSCGGSSERSQPPLRPMQLDLLSFGLHPASACLQHYQHCLETRLKPRCERSSLQSLHRMFGMSDNFVGYSDKKQKYIWCFLLSILFIPHRGSGQHVAKVNND